MTKKIIACIIAIILMLLIGQGVVKATSPSLTVEGDSKVKAGKTGSMTLNVTSGDSKAAAIKGKIEIDSKIETLTANDVKGSNGWEVTYNQATGDFNIVKAAGATQETEGCLTITYTMKSNASGTANIKISGVEVADLAYQKESISGVSKSITIETETQTPVVPDPGTTGEETSGTAGGTTGTTTSGGSNASQKDTSATAKTKIPQTGDNIILIVGIGTILAVAGVVAYVRYKRTY